MSTRVASLYAEIGAKTDGLKAGLASAKAGLAGFAANAKGSLARAGAAWSELATPINQTLQILGQVGQAAQQAYQYVSEGTQLATTAHQFDALSNSIGTTADALLGDLKTATRGTISDAKLMASATSIMSLGLAATSEETVRLASLVGKLGWDMNQVTLTLANQSTMRLDSLGLSVSDVTDRVDALKASGMSADQAFKFAILEAGEEKVKLLGDSADTTAGQLKILESNVANAGDAFKMAFSENFIQNLNATAGGLFEVQENASSLFSTLGAFTTNFSFMGFIRAARDGIADLGDTGTSTSTKISGMGGVVNKALNAMAAGMSAGAKAAAAHDAAVLANIIAIDDRSEAIKSHNQVLQDGMSINQANTQAVYESSDAYAELQERIGGSEYIQSNAAAVRVANQRLTEWGNTIPTVTGAIYASSEAVSAYNANLGSLYLTARETEEASLLMNSGIRETADAFLTSGAAIGMNATELAGLELAFSDMTAAEAEARIKSVLLEEEIARLTEQVKLKNITIYEARDAYIAFQQGLNDSTIAVNSTTGSVLLMNDSMMSSATTTQNLLDKFGLFPDEVGTVVRVDTSEAESRLSSLEARLAGLGSGGQPATASGGYQAGPDMPGGGGNVAPGAAAGANYIVPPGYNENWYQPASSGEHVEVTPAGQSRGGDTYILNVTAMDGGANITREFNYMKAMAGV